MLVLAGEINHLGNLGLCDFVGIDPADTHTVLMDMQHDGRRLFHVFIEELLNHVHHKLHRGVVVIQDQNLVQRRFFGLRLATGNDSGVGSIPPIKIIIAVIISHAGLKNSFMGSISRQNATRGTRNRPARRQ